jgi:hypothetical protein
VSARRARERRGVALVAALGFMAVIGLLIGGAVASSTLAQRSSRLAHADAELTAAAEFALNDMFGEATVRALGDLQFGKSGTFDAASPVSTIETRVIARRLPFGVAWLTAQARRRDIDAGVRRVNLVARWRFPSELPGAAVVARGNVRVGAGVAFSVDTTTDADCRANPHAPNVVTAPAATVTSAESLLVGTRTTAGDSASYFLSLRSNRAGLVHVLGDTTLFGGTVEGVLMIDGALTVAGPVTVNGLVVARGRIEASAGALFLTGAAMSFAPRDSGHAAVHIGGGTIRYSPCVISRVLRRVVPLRPVRQRGWAELF